jgi:hypothetical protein
MLASIQSFCEGYMFQEDCSLSNSLIKTGQETKAVYQTTHVYNEPTMLVQTFPLGMPFFHPKHSPSGVTRILFINLEAILEKALSILESIGKQPLSILKHNSNMSSVA